MQEGEMLFLKYKVENDISNHILNFRKMCTVELLKSALKCGKL